MNQIFISNVGTIRAGGIAGLLGYVAGGLLASGCAQPEHFMKTDGGPVGPQVVECSVSRTACTAENLDAAGVARCNLSENQRFTATICTPDSNDLVGKCQAIFCAQPPDVAYDFGVCSSSAEISDLPLQGTCQPFSPGNGHHLTHVSFSQSFYECTRDPETNVCALLSKQTPGGDLCLDPSKASVVTQIQPPSNERARGAGVLTLENDSPDCPVVGAPPLGALTFEVPPGPIGVISGGGVSAGLQVTRGVAVIGQQCDPGGEFCTDILTRLDLDLADVTVSGLPLTNVALTLISPVALTAITPAGGGTAVTGAATGALTFLITGQLMGADTFYIAQNGAPWTVNASTTALSLGGQLALTASDLTGKQAPISATLAVTGQPATAAELACANLTPLQRLLGFEDVRSWHATSNAGALSLATSPLTQGCGGLAVTGQGYIPISGDPFSTVGLSTGHALSVDLFIPTDQPNPHWLGAVQASLSCPSGNVFNQYIGQVELTGKTPGAFSSLRFALPVATASTLARGLSDCALSLALNVNPTGQAWIFDNLRFSN